MDSLYFKIVTYMLTWNKIILCLAFLKCKIDISYHNVCYEMFIIIKLDKMAECRFVPNILSGKLSG